MISKEKIEALAKYMGESEERAEMLMAMSADDACAKINADGYDFTAEELAEFSRGMLNVFGGEEGELDENQLDDVAGGGSIRDIYDIYVEHMYWAQKKGYQWGRAIGRWLFS